ncbi:uncharacterized protein OCT59_003437 [Rhizophagus irregularis]|uniref:MATA-HMG n=5 Tax=Rhizophagus irregularis TaxID=588596 RepID=A0A1B1EV85_9GLOM|nr:hypothetical protein GLOIN_2v1874985 [Rhizophagus irregularis DAOM 181602=DAOM 197198]ANQ32708.1 MATA-HMG [Rhizophagus irregularis]POG72718.1 hypothetical protein GLOIN_2v1874985 [Rhizophagus irregularis DAOM 181602=DAOM 197198]UZO11884.1 hypothetical protein OCT59_003437 [Rhizophagus irregularis]CAB5352887.1 unnamed protein product [Rhizophagus irregularis]CAG8720771.1 14657_t:CDS:1 [Rhizophagus irregularis]|eukprot:XP_025179584.1 hypothetical protein GLOIN_2v1874985 [Rhizophagus irregularis DAOM 181602=DAOM 197198]
MSKGVIPVENLAVTLMNKLNRRNIFPPLFNNPESFVPPIDSKKKPFNSFLICRRNVYKESNCKGNHNMRVICKAASILWNNATLEEKNVYKEIADRVYEIYLLRSGTFNFKLNIPFPKEPPPRPPSATNHKKDLNRSKIYFLLN